MVTWQLWISNQEDERLCKQRFWLYTKNAHNVSDCTHRGGLNGTMVWGWVRLLCLGGGSGTDAWTRVPVHTRKSCPRITTCVYLHLFFLEIGMNWTAFIKNANPILKLALQRSQPVTRSGQATQRQATSLDPLFSSTLQTEGKYKNSQSSGAGDSYSGTNLKRPTGFEEQVKQSFGGEQDRVS